MLLKSIAKLPGINGFTTLLFRIEAAWFDITRRVETSRRVDLDGLTLSGQRKDGFPHLPVRPSTARNILKRLPIEDPEQYVFLDLGSGLGRMLLIAAEHPFRQIYGVEFALELHRKAEANIRSYRNRKQKCTQICLLLMNAVDYTFPNENLVIYFFNPFGREVMEQVIRRLTSSLQEWPRRVVIVMLYPDFSFLIDACPEFHLYQNAHRYRIYCNFRPTN